MKDTGFISGGDYMIQSGVRMCVAVVPNALRKVIFQSILRRKVNNTGGVIPEFLLCRLNRLDVWSAVYGL